MSQNEVPSLRACALAARRAARAVTGVARLDGCLCGWLVGGVPGVEVREDDHHRLYVEVSVNAHMSQHLNHLGQIVQAAVADALKEIPGRRAVAIDIIITGIRFDKRALPKAKEFTR